MANDVNDVPTLAARPEIDERNAETDEGIDRDTKPRRRFLAIEVAAMVIGA